MMCLLYYLDYTKCLAEYESIGIETFGLHAVLALLLNNNTSIWYNNKKLNIKKLWNLHLRYVFKWGENAFLNTKIKNW